MDDILDRKFADALVADFADVNLLPEVRKYATWILDHPYKANSSPRAQFRNWCERSRRYAVRDAKAGAPGPSPDVETQLAELNRARGLA